MLQAFQNMLHLNVHLMFTFAQEQKLCHFLLLFHVWMLSSLKTFIRKSALSSREKVVQFLRSPLFLQFTVQILNNLSFNVTLVGTETT